MKLSIVNLGLLREGQDYRQAIESIVKLAQVAEELELERYWIAEHHNSKHLVSTSTQLLIQHTLSNTKKIKVGAGGVMLPNHSPYIVAEQYAMLATLYPERVELGLGRAPGMEVHTVEALRRHLTQHDFPMDLIELRSYFESNARVHAYLAENVEMPFYILGSSTESAYLAAELGLPYSYAAHFVPETMEEAIAVYRNNFKPSKYLAAPYVILGFNVIVADTDDEAKHLATTQTQLYLDIVTDQQYGLRPPLKSDKEVWQRPYVHADHTPHFGPVDFSNIPLYDQEEFVVKQLMACSLIGSPKTVEAQLKVLKSAVKFEEIIALSHIFDEEKQYYSYRLFNEIVRRQ
ncbi:luciferase family oxidoreductase group 1 [Cricetibacter osteomyelitidis]|uniref:Luciferase family oxidoreductase group 1 n=1 Tax=Cricetibacter osteomyelitidis TaxID=1521931 RepID=A0A4R2TMN2_9PAST|nr:LLM class flavin-dependent oxidoreductase [Cricetibacter osteomyelitidis]TCP96182.1 luciferase family oxidoreductase group 1 [Cricetibacter osteomyelitidis]